MEDFFRDNEGLIYDRVKWHTRKKHAFIESYLNIWVENVRNHPPTLDIFDLFASTGLCSVKKVRNINSASRCGRDRQFLLLNAWNITQMDKNYSSIHTIRNPPFVKHRK